MVGFRRRRTPRGSLGVLHVGQIAGSRAGVDGGLRRIGPYMCAVAVGYLASGLILGLPAAPLLIVAPSLVDALRLAAAAYLPVVAWRM